MKYAVSAELYDQSLPQITTAKSVVTHFLSQHPLTGEEHIIDACCGTGKLVDFLSEYVPNGDVLGLDSAENMIEFAQKYRAKNNVSLQVNDLCVFNSSYKKFADLIVCSWAVSHIPTEKQKDFTNNLYQYLKNEGCLIVVFPVMGSILATVIQEVAKSDAWSEYFRYFENKRTTFTVQEYNELLTRTGFINTVVQTHMEHLSFSSRSELKCFVTTAVARYLPCLDEPMLCEAFINDVVNHYQQKVGATEDSIPYSLTILSAIAKRPGLALILETGSPISPRREHLIKTTVSYESSSLTNKDCLM